LPASSVQIAKVTDPRRRQRLAIIKNLYAWSFQANAISLGATSRKIIDQLPTIDQSLKQYAPKWALSKINQIDLAILRYSIWELTHHHQLPPKVVINEAVEIAKIYGNDNSSKFINGVLGTIVRELQLLPDESAST